MLTELPAVDLGAIPEELTAERKRPGGEYGYSDEEAAVQAWGTDAPLRYAPPSQPSYLARGVARLRVRTHVRLPLPKAVTATAPEKRKKKPKAAELRPKLQPFLDPPQNVEVIKPKRKPRIVEEEGES